MTRQGHTSTHAQARGETPARSTHPANEERPFAEIRKNLHNALRLLAAHRWAFMVPCCLAASVIFALSLYTPRTYTATALFERHADPIIDDLPTNEVSAAYDYFRKTMVRDLLAVGCMVDIVDQLGLSKDLERNDDGTFTDASLRRRDTLARMLRGRLGIRSKTASPHVDSIRITYTGSDPQIGRKLVDAMKAAYTGHTLEWMTQYLERRYEYFSRESAAALADLNALSRKRTERVMDHPHFDPRDPSAIATGIARFEMERRELLVRRREYETQLTAARQTAAVLGQPSSVGRTNRPAAVALSQPLTPQTQALVAKIETLIGEIEEFRALRGMTDEHPEVRERLAKRRWLEAELEKQAARDPAAGVANAPLDTDPAIGEGDDGLVQWRRQRTGLDIQIAAQETKIREIDISLETNERVLAQMRQAKQDVFQTQEEFAAMDAEVEKARNRHYKLDSVVTAIGPAIKALKQRRLLRFTEEQPTTASNLPISPKAKNIFLLAFVVGIAAGAIFVILAELFDHVYRSSGQVARSLGLPILEAIDEIITAQGKRRQVVQRLVITPLVLASLLGAAGVTGSMAYLSVQQPWTYEKIKSLPDRARKLFAGETGTDEPSRVVQAS